jgi:hypothetical protein
MELGQGSSSPWTRPKPEQDPTTCKTRMSCIAGHASFRHATSGPGLGRMGPGPAEGRQVGRDSAEAVARPELVHDVLEGAALTAGLPPRAGPRRVRRASDGLMTLTSSSSGIIAPVPRLDHPNTKPAEMKGAVFAFLRGFPFSCREVMRTWIPFVADHIPEASPKCSAESESGFSGAAIPV